MPVATLFDGTRNLGTYDFDLDIGKGGFEFHQCGTCGIVWGLPCWFIEQRRKDHVGWLCPNGHSFVFKGLSDEEKLRRDLKFAKDDLARVRARADQTEASLRATKGVVTKQRKKLEKVVAGVCPVDGCKRHFKDLRRHISTKHPDYHAQV